MRPLAHRDLTDSIDGNIGAYADTVGKNGFSIAEPTAQIGRGGTKARTSTTPLAASNPNAEPPESTIASTWLTVFSGASSSVSRVPGAAPMTWTPASIGRWHSRTVTPLRTALSSACPIRSVSRADFIKSINHKKGPVLQPGLSETFRSDLVNLGVFTVRPFVEHVTRQGNVAFSIECQAAQNCIEITSIQSFTHSVVIC